MNEDYSDVKEPLRSICDNSRKLSHSKRIAFEPACRKALRELKMSLLSKQDSFPGDKDEVIQRDDIEIGVNDINKVDSDKPNPLLGDMLSKALSAVGITEERVSTWLGRPCGCGERKQKLNSLHAWFLGDKSAPPTMD